MKTKEMILRRLKEAREQMECWELDIVDYNKFVKHCRKLLDLLKKRDATIDSSRCTDNC